MEGKQNYICSICLEILTDPVSTECNHSFCYYCIEELTGFQENLKCPLCRAQIGKIQNLKQNPQLKEYIAKNYAQDYERRKYYFAEKNRLKAMFMTLIIEYGNTHSFVENPQQSRTSENYNSEKWTCFVNLRGMEDKQTDYISYVEFILDPTFEITVVKENTPPYEVTRKGWGTFNIPIKIFWKKWLNIQSPTELYWELDFNHRLSQNIHTVQVNKEKMGKPPKPRVPSIRN